MLKLGGVPCQPPGLGRPSSKMEYGEAWSEPSSILSRVMLPGGRMMSFWLIVGMNPRPSLSNFA